MQEISCYSSVSSADTGVPSWQRHVDSVIAPTPFLDRRSAAGSDPRTGRNGSVLPSSDDIRGSAPRRQRSHCRPGIPHPHPPPGYHHRH